MHSHQVSAHCETLESSRDRQHRLRVVSIARRLFYLEYLIVSHRRQQPPPPSPSPPLLSIIIHPVFFPRMRALADIITFLFQGCLYQDNSLLPFALGERISLVQCAREETSTTFSCHESKYIRRALSKRTETFVAINVEARANPKNRVLYE